MAEKRKPTKKAQAATPKRMKSAPRPTRTKAAITEAQGPANSYLYSEAIGDEICRRLAEGASLNSICRSEGMPGFATITAWALDLSHPFAEKYARAREIGWRRLAEQILEIADDSKGDIAEGKVDHENIARARLRVDTRKWMLSKMLPKIYGDKVVNELTGPGGGPVQVQAQVESFMAKIREIAQRQQEMKALAEAENENSRG